MVATAPAIAVLLALAVVLPLTVLPLRSVTASLAQALGLAERIASDDLAVRSADAAKEIKALIGVLVERVEDVDPAVQERDNIEQRGQSVQQLEPITWQNPHWWRSLLPPHSLCVTRLPRCCRP